MALLTKQKIVEAGLTPAFGAATVSGDTIDNSDGKTILHYKNASAGAITVTVASQLAAQEDPKLGTVTKGNIVKVIAAGAEAIIGPFKKQAFNNGNNQISVTYSGVTSLTVAALTIDF